MGVNNNEAMLATTSDSVAMKTVTNWINSLTPLDQDLFATINGTANGTSTIVLAPCGSKKGWPQDAEAKVLRVHFTDLLVSLNYEDGSNPFSWIEVGFGEYGQKVLAGNNTNAYTASEYAEEEE